MSESTATIEDGRHARRARNRDAVIDALFDLLNEGPGMPGIEAIAARANVSVSSIFRYFEGLEDLKHETIERYFTRFAELFTIPEMGEGDLEGRIERFVDARMRLYEAIAPIARLARARAYDQPPIAAPLARARAIFNDQVRRHFAPELGRHGADVDELAALIDTVASFESWDLQQLSHGRNLREVRTGWVFALGRLLAD